MSEEQNLHWEFQGAIPVSRHGDISKFQISLDAGTLAEMYEHGIIKYVGDIQRGYQTNRKGEEVPVFNRKEVKELYRLMVANKLNGNLITLNYPAESGVIEYDEDSNNISGNNYLQILDGHHRVRSCLLWWQDFQKDKVQQSPYDYEFTVSVENLSEEEAKRLFVEYSALGTKISKTRISYLDTMNYSNYIANYIIKHSELNDERVELVKQNIKRKPQIVTFAVLTQAIEQNFKPKTRQEATEIAKYLSTFFDNLINTFRDTLGEMDINKQEQIKENFLINEQIMMYGMVCLASQIQHVPNWEDYITKMKEQSATLFDRNNPIWNPILKEDKKIINNSTTVKKVGDILIEQLLGSKQDVAAGKEE